MGASYNATAVKRLSALAALGITLVIVCAAAASPSPAAARASVVVCPWKVASLVTALDTIDGELNAGVSLYDYGELIDRAIAASDRVSLRTVRLACNKRVYLPALRAINAHIDAYNSWLKCMDWYDDPSRANERDWGLIPDITCEDVSGPGYLYRQGKWTIAHANVSRAIDALG